MIAISSKYSRLIGEWDSGFSEESVQPPWVGNPRLEGISFDLVGAWNFWWNSWAFGGVCSASLVLIVFSWDGVVAL